MPNGLKMLSTASLERAPRTAKPYGREWMGRHLFAHLYLVNPPHADPQPYPEGCRASTTGKEPNTFRSSFRISGARALKTHRWEFQVACVVMPTAKRAYLHK